jgi:hypothetical protein
MLSESRAREIDYYFLYDHQARRKTFLIASAIGFVSYLFCKVIQESSDQKAFIVSFALIAATFYTRLAPYRHPAERTTRSSHRVKGKSVEEEFGISWNRRQILVRLSVSAASFIALIYGNQKLTLAEAMNNGIARLRKSGHIADAMKLARTATKSDIPLSLDNVTSLDVHVLSEPVLNDSTWLPTGRNLALIRIADGSVLNIWLPVVYLPQGTFQLEGSLNNLGAASMVGDGPFQSYLSATYPETPTTSAILECSAFRADALVYGLGGMQKAEFQTSSPPAFIKFDGKSLHRLVVASVSLTRLKQVLDEIVWQDAVFIDCDVVCSGGKFQLINSKFVDCRFTFSGNIPSNVKETLLRQQTVVTLKFSPK